MAQIGTSWNGGDGTTTTGTIAPYAGPTDYSGLADFVRRMMLRRQMATEGPAPQASAPAPRVVSEPTRSETQSDPLAYMRQQADASDLRRRIIESEEATRPAPMAYLPSGPGITGGYVTDPRAMDSFQRKNYLAQDSRIAPSDNSAQEAQDAKAKDPLADKFSDAYRNMVAQGYTAEQIAMIRQQQLAAKQGGR